MRQVVRRGVPVSRTVTNLVGHVATTSDVPRVVASASLSLTNDTTQLCSPVSESVVVQPTNTPAPPVVSSAPLVATNLPTTAIAKLVEAFPVKSTTNKLVVGIAWSASVDLDLWVRANPTAHDLYFNNKTTREGRYLHDWRGRNLGVDYEYVELNPDASVDLSEVGAWVNYYEGKASPVQGVVVVIYEGLSYYGEFTLSSPGGNKGRDNGKRDQSRYWIRLNLAELVKSGNTFCPTAKVR